MTIDTPKDEILERLLQDIARNLEDNHRFIKGIKEEHTDYTEEIPVSSETEEDFEEL